MRERVVDVRRGLGVQGDRVRAGGRELVDLALGALDHQVDVEDPPVDLVAQGLDDQRADRDRRDEVPVHDVDVDHAAPRVHDLADLLAEAREVGGEDRRRDRDLARQPHQMARSMLPPQLLHVTIAVLDMRTIVECSPQSGHTDTSSKRCRQ